MRASSTRVLEGFNLMNEHRSSMPGPESDPLWDVFVDPPDDARPRVWWHWMDGNIDPAGL